MQQGSRVIRKVEFNPSKYVRNGLTENEICEIKELFDQFDTDHSGTISVQELRTALSGIALNDNQTINQIWAECDRDKSGYLDLDEFISMLVGPNQDTDSREDIRKVFNLFLGDDANSRENNKISAHHLRRIAKELNEHMTDEEINELIIRADNDRDGAVDFEEFYQIMTRKI
jgi:Ca2+-binding EF-hand superfamily protein